MRLYLPLKKKWFNLIKTGEKTQEYREINEYWFRRLFEKKGFCTDISIVVELLQENSYTSEEIKTKFGWQQKFFKYAVLKLGYPNAEDSERIIEVPLKNIHVGRGKKEWGAEPDKNYFIITI